MWRSLLALVALSRVAALLAQLPTAATMVRFNTDKENAKIANKSLEFVQIIREDLRRNNDDYEMLERQKLLATQLRQEHIPPNRNRIPPMRPPAFRVQTKRPPPKRGLPQRHQPEPPNHRPAPIRAPSFRGAPPRQPPKMSINTRRGFNMTNNITSEVSVVPNVTQFRSYTHAKHYKKVRVDKLKRLVDKEKNRMNHEQGRTGTDGGPGGTTPTAPGTPPAEDTRPPDTPPTNATTVTPTPQPLFLTTTRRPHKPADESEAQKQALRQPEESGSPSPDQLDMAPARGPQITLIRFKGRLCQRNLMNIEGPTYDKLGKSVMPAHKPDRAFGRQFHQTRMPTLVLPRCCNCCKKSVLGCQ